jgi:hypothetical protein
MSTDRDMTRIVRSWLEEGATALPDRVLDAVLDQVPATPQRSAWWPARRSNELNSIAKVLIAAAAVVAIAVVGLNFLPRDRGVSGPAPTPSPTPSPIPTASPIALTASDVDRALGAGTYTFDDLFTVPFRITFGPGGWTQYGQRPGEVDFGIDKSDAPEPYIAVEVVEGVYRDPCRSETGIVGSPDMTVDEIVAAFSTMTGFEMGPVSDTEIGGLPAKRFDLTNAIDTTAEACAGGAMLPLVRNADGNGAPTNGNLSQTMWVVDVDGTNLLFWGENLITSPDPAVETVESALETVQFE